MPGEYISAEIETLEEIDEEGDAFSGPKHWHVFDIIAKKRDAYELGELSNLQ